MIDYLEAYNYAIESLKVLSIKHEIHTFPSGAIMLDIWLNKDFYVFDFYPAEVGFTKIDSHNPGFTTKSEIYFNTQQEFQDKIDTLLGKPNLIGAE